MRIIIVTVCHGNLDDRSPRFVWFDVCKHSHCSHCPYGDKLFKEVLRLEKDALDDGDEFLSSRRKRHDLG